MTNEKPIKLENPKISSDIDKKHDENNAVQQEEKGGFGKQGNGKPEPTRYNDWEVDGRCSDF
ncbi:MAG: DUF1674 domain-containing protein [Bdellovibrionales bacterium]